MTDVKQPTSKSPESKSPKPKSPGTESPESKTPDTKNTEVKSGNVKCDRCKIQLTDEDRYNVMGMVFHINCLNCDECSVNLSKGFHYDFGRFYCYNCVLTLVPKCAGCKKIIGFNDSLKAADSEWHIGCCVCNACKQPFEGGRYFALDGKPYCLQCYWYCRMEKEQQQLENTTSKTSQDAIVKTKQTKKRKKSSSKKGSRSTSIDMEEY